MASTEVLSKSLLLPCGQRLSNRIAKAAMTEHLADHLGVPDERLLRLYSHWAEGGASLLLTGNVMIDSADVEGEGNVIIESDASLPQLSEWARAIQDGGASGWMQIGHAGALSLSPTPLSPSGIPHTGLRRRFSTPRAMTASEILDVIRRFAFAATIATRAGFSGVQIHSAHGFLLNQFLSPLTNRRTDSWGGPLKNRMRLLIEVVQATRDAVGKSVGVGVKLNTSDYERGGLSEEDSLEVCQALQREEVDLIEFSGGSYRRTVMLGDPSRTSDTPRPEAFFLDFARRARARISTPIMLTGGMRTVALMVDVVRTGVADLIGLARPLAVWPNLPRLILNSEIPEVPPCAGEKIENVFDQLSWFQARLAEFAMRARNI